MSDTGNFGVYGILTDPVVGYEKLAAIMVDNGVRYIQLRMKDWAAPIVRDMARRIRRIVVGESLFIINDHPEIARDVGADGVHLGQGDMSIEEARRILDKDAVIGLSTHCVDQTRTACAQNPAYIGVGPVYATPTKRIPDPVIGIDGMCNMLSHATCSAVAIGGIDLSNLGEVLEGGARNACAVRCVNRAENPDAVLKKMRRIIASFEGR